MKLTEVLQLMKEFRDSDITRFEWEKDGEKIAFENSKTQETTVNHIPKLIETSSNNFEENIDTVTLKEDVLDIKATIVGVFYASPSPTSPAFVKVGDVIKKGQVICLIEAMKLMSELTSPVDGRIVAIKVQNEDVVSFNQVLFEVVSC
ncbi:MAG: acetyl-CoA carboxylase biotin carboxyl carrier protein [Oscillospiraceae bacterium]